MKKTLMILCFLHVAVIALPQYNKFSFTWAYGLAGGSQPTITPITTSESISKKLAENLIRFFTDSTKIDFKCIYNGCQNRAALMSLYLTKMGIKHYKIWNFDPYKISIFNRQDALDVHDVLNLRAGRINWDFHVAVAVLINVEKQNTCDTLIIDPAFSEVPLTVIEWLNLQNSPNSFYTFLDPVWYNYVTVQPGLTWSCNGIIDSLKIPNCFPFLLTGDFYPFHENKHSIVAEEMAVNETITYMARNKIHLLETTNPLRNSLSTAVSDYNKFKAFLQSANAPEPGSPLFDYTAECRRLYATSLSYWIQEFKRITQ